MALVSAFFLGLLSITYFNLSTFWLYTSGLFLACMFSSMRLTAYTQSFVGTGTRVSWDYVHEHGRFEHWFGNWCWIGRIITNVLWLWRNWDSRAPVEELLCYLDNTSVNSDTLSSLSSLYMVCVISCARSSGKLGPAHRRN